MTTTVDVLEAPAGRATTVAPTGRQVLVLVPAHDEASTIGRALGALRAQELDRHPDSAVRLVVVADNCTDATAPLSLAAGAEVFTTRDNRAKKGGALNQALNALLPELADHDAVLVTDADCALDPGFLAAALDHLDRGYSGVGGVFRGDPGGGFVGHLQRNEHARYARDVERLRGRCLVLTGTAALFRAATLRQISASRRDGRLPAGDGAGGVYDTTVLTEDNELTFAILHLGGRIISPAACTLATEVMPDWRSLWRQRLRWKRGAVENCVQYGLTAVTWRYWGRQLFTLLGVVASVLYLATLVWAFAFTGSVHVQLFWLAVTGVFVVERVVTLRKRGWRRMLAAASMYELVIDYFLQACHGKAYLDALLRRRKNW